MKKDRVAIIDYGLCNLFSVVHACEHIGLEAIVTDDIDEILSADAAILPGVGAFGKAITEIRKKKLDFAIDKFISSGKPFLGICLGLHLLFDSSEEFGYFEGLGIIPGKVRKIQSSHGKVPQIGWNTIEVSKENLGHPLVESIREGEYMYFTHSFFVEPLNIDNVLTYTNYGKLRYCSSVCRDNVVACQFHPEKSGVEGIRVYRNFKSMIKNKGKR